MMIASSSSSCSSVMSLLLLRAGHQTRLPLGSRSLPLLLRLPLQSTCPVSSSLFFSSSSTPPQKAAAAEKETKKKKKESGGEQEEEEREASRLKRMLASRARQAAVHWEYSQDYVTSSRVYDRKPIKIECTQGRIYMWCSCGQSKSQPFCDGTHRLQHLQILTQPIPWLCEETGQYWFCNCKKTVKAPFCDGAHLRLPPNISSASSTSSSEGETGSGGGLGAGAKKGERAPINTTIKY